MKVCPKCNKEIDDVKGDFCIYCGERLIKTKKNNKDFLNNKTDNLNKNTKTIKIQRIIIIILTVILFLLAGCIVYLGIIRPKSKISDIENQKIELENKVTNLNSRISKLNNEKTKLNKENLKLQSKADFLDENVVFVIDGYGNYYYTYDQMKQVTQGKSYSFWAYNKSQAIGLGYRAWK